MRAHLRRHRGLHLWLLSVLALLGLYFALREVPGLMTWLCGRVIWPLERASAALCYLSPVSMAECLLMSLVAVGVFYLANTLRRLLRKGQRGRVLYRFALTLLCAGLSIYAILCLGWGAFYYTPSFQQQSGLYARESTAEELTRVTEYFAGQLADSADDVRRDESGLFAESRADIFADSVRAYENSYDEFPCLRLRDQVPKAISASTVLSATDTTGFYFPLTGEANLNVDSPACYLPATIVHELAHQRGIASEQECNFIAVVVSTRADSPAYRYSGWLLGFTHLSNALYRADQEAWQRVWAQLPDTVLADLRDNNAYWRSFQGPVNDAAQNWYDSFLKDNGEERGTQSYGAVVDLLMAYYGDDT